VSALQQLLRTEFCPAPYLVYKPNKQGSGQAMKVHLRLNPNWIETEGGNGYFERPKDQGLFVEIAPQEGTGEGGFAKFGWNSPGLVRCKWGMVDVTKWLTSYREVRFMNAEVPFAYRPGPDRNATPNVLSTFHKYGQHSTAINYTFEPTRSILRISKSKDLARSIALDLNEEVGLAAYFELSLNAFLRVGIR
jgi:hypothetical protein